MIKVAKFGGSSLADAGQFKKVADIIELGKKPEGEKKKKLIESADTLSSYSPSEAAETICIKVRGDSMYPTIDNGDINNAEEELGDLLFSIVNVSRFLKINPEEALKKSTDKFVSRFEKIEQLAKSLGKDLNEMSLSEMDELWDKVKAN